MGSIKLDRSLLKSRTSWKLFSIIITICCLSISMFASETLRPMHTEKLSFTNLNTLMQDGVHEHFTMLSFTIYHDESPFAQKTETIVNSALELSKLANQIPKVHYELRDKDWTSQKEEFLRRQAEVMATTSQRLAEAAKNGDLENTTRMFNSLENSCNSCHASFRRDLLTVVDNK